MKIVFPGGRYDFYAVSGVNKEYYISNATEKGSNAIRTVGFLLQDMNDIIIDGNDSLFVFHGKMTTLAVEGCDNVALFDINIDFERPTVSEMTVISKTDSFIDFKVHKDSAYVIENGCLIWVGEDWRCESGPAQIYDKLTGAAWRTQNPQNCCTKAEELSTGVLRLYFDKPIECDVGNVFQMRDGIRDQVGVLICRSKNVSFRNVSMHFMHGLGVVSQFSENLTFDHVPLYFPV